MNIDKILGTMFSHIENSTVFCVCHVQLHRSFHLTIFDRTPIQLFNLTNCKWTCARPEWKSISIASSTCSFYACNMCEYESKTAIALATARNNIKKSHADRIPLFNVHPASRPFVHVIPANGFLKGGSRASKSSNIWNPKGPIEWRHLCLRTDGYPFWFLSL